MIECRLRATKRSAASADSIRQVDAVIAASRVLVGVVAQSVADVEDQVTLPQLRVPVMVATAAAELGRGCRPSGRTSIRATRTVDRFAAARLVDRREATIDRRNVSIS
jgi:hypothetical protein